MPPITLPLTSLVGGVSTRPQSDRPVGTVAEALNTMMRANRGSEKRPGSVLIKAPTTNFNLDITNPTQPKFFHWIDRDEDEKFLIVVDPLNSGDARVECFTLVQRGNGSGSPGNEKAGQKMGFSSILSGSDDPLDYIGAPGTSVARHRFRALTVTDTTIITNRDVNTGLTGDEITYSKEDGSFIRVTDPPNSNNKPSWNSFPHPPSNTVLPGVTSSDFIFYARDDDLGWPAGWYRASSTTVPPWYERIRTEPANSSIDKTKWPVQLKFTGSAFELSFPDWLDRFSGDSFSNPGPQLTSGPSAPHKIVDMCYFQSRLWFGGYEFIDSSQTGDVFNLWNESYVGITDTDCINVSLQSDAVTTVDWLVPFDGGIVCFTRGARQFEIRSQGIMSPSTVSILPATAYQTVEYCPPTKVGSQLYFMAERNGYAMIFEYLFQADRASNVATNITSEVDTLIPIRAWTIQPSNLNDMLFVLTTGDPTNMYVHQMQWDQGRKSQAAWFKWTFNRAVFAAHVIGPKLYFVTQRAGGKLYLEVLNVDIPVNDDSLETPTTVNGYSGSGNMGFELCLDAKATYQGVYDPDTDRTTWTIPYEDNRINRVVLGQMFDCNYEFPPSSGTFLEQRRKGTVFSPTSQGGNLTVITGGGTTTVSCPGNYAKNANGDNALVWIGINYSKDITLNEQFARDESGTVIPGLIQLKHLVVQLADTAYLRVEITPEGRDAIAFEYQDEQWGRDNFGEGLASSPYEEFHLPCLAKAHDTRIRIINDTVFPSRIVGGIFRASFVPARSTPTSK